MKEKIAFVCQRYGLEVNGGAEMECRQYAEALVPYYDVEVYTTRAMDYVTWANAYDRGDETINGVTVHRFDTEREREQKRFDAVTAEAYAPGHKDRTEETWIEEQGPVCPTLLAALKERHKEYKAVLFMTYLYYPSARGLLLGLDNAILIPTVHDEPPVYLRWYDKVFGGAKRFVWNTEEEKVFAEKRFPAIKGRPGVTVGAGVDFPTGTLPELPPELKGSDYIVYAGRVDVSKGCDRMFKCFRWYREHRNPDLKLALMGKAAMEIPGDKGIVALGFVTEEMKYAVMRDARALVLFSKYESLSIVVLESMMMGRPVLVNGECEVLKGHCVRSRAGLYFENDREFAATLDYLTTHPEVYEAMRENGRKYVNENYRWDRITEKLRNLIDGNC